MEDDYFSPKFAVEKPKVSLKKPDDKKSDKKQPVIKKAEPKQVGKKDADPPVKSSRSEITRRYYVRKSLMQGKVPKNLKEEDVKNPKLEKLNDILNRLKKKDEPEPVESEEEPDEEDPDDEEPDEEEPDDEEPDEEEEKPVAKRKPQVLDKDDVISRLDAITDMLMYLVEQEEAREDEEPDDEEPDEEEEKQVAPKPVRHANINFPHQRPVRICFAG